MCGEPDLSTNQVWKSLGKSIPTPKNQLARGRWDQMTGEIQVSVNNGGWGKIGETRDVYTAGDIFSNWIEEH